MQSCKYVPKQSFTQFIHMLYGWATTSCKYAGSLRCWNDLKYSGMPWVLGSDAEGQDRGVQKNRGKKMLLKRQEEKHQRWLRTRYFPIHKLQKHTRFFFLLLPVKIRWSQMAKEKHFLFSKKKNPPVGTNGVTKHEPNSINYVGPCLNTF